MGKLVRETTTVTERVYLHEDGEAGLAAPPEAAQAAGGTEEAPTAKAAPEAAALEGADEAQGGSDEHGEGQGEHEDPVRVTLRERDCYCPRPGTRVRVRGR